MLTRIDNVLSAQELETICGVIERVGWESGKSTASGAAAEVKNNLQLPHDNEDTRALSKQVLEALNRNRNFVMTTYPRRIGSPRFSGYEPGMAYGEHVDIAIMPANPPLRTDIAMTLFLSDPTSYDGGELMIQTSGAETAVKLPAGSMVCYPPYFLHRVAPVTRGIRLAAVMWTESLVRSSEQREILTQLNQTVDSLRQRNDATSELNTINNCYQTLTRMWVDS